MASLGLTKAGNPGAGAVPPLQRAWLVFAETTLQNHDDKIDALKDFAEGTASGIRSALRVPVLAVTASSVGIAVAALGMFAIRLWEVLR